MPYNLMLIAYYTGHKTCKGPNLKLDNCQGILYRGALMPSVSALFNADWPNIQVLSVNTRDRIFMVIRAFLIEVACF